MLYFCNVAENGGCSWHRGQPLVGSLSPLLTGAIWACIPHPKIDAKVGNGGSSQQQWQRNYSFFRSHPRRIMLLPGLLDWRRLNYYFPWKLDRSRQESQVFLSSPHEFLLRWMKSDLPSGICSDPPSSCLSSGLCGGFAARHVEARSSNKERSWVQVFYRIVEFAANIGGLNINAEL